MAVMLLIIYLYYSVAVYPGPVNTETVVNQYQYDQEYHMGKRDASYDQEDNNVAENDYYNEPVKSENDYVYEVARNKRDNQTSPTASVTTANPKAAKMGGAKKTKSSKEPDQNQNTGNASSDGTSNNSQAPKEEEEEVLDFKLSNSFVDTVHAEADQNKMKESLGLCRKTIDLAVPEMNVTLFPLEQAQEIITCINENLKNQSKKHLCIELNEEMNAYLKWLVLTGDSKERRKQIKISAYHDDFLFPSTCGTNVQYMEGFTQLPIPQPSGIPVGPVPMGPPVATRSPAEQSGSQSVVQQYQSGSQSVVQQYQSGSKVVVQQNQAGGQALVQQDKSDVLLTTCAPVVPAKT